MGWGNYLVITKDQDLLTRYIEDALNEDGVSEVCRLRQSPGGIYMALMGGDCGVMLSCGTCGNPVCVGCGQAGVFTLDDERMTCRLCDPKGTLGSTIDRILLPMT